ncbi:helix-turn-helix domain-containing protein [Chloroflexota bacterium]
MDYNKDMPKCPHCKQTERQHKAGKTEAGTQRYRCMFCMRRYSPDPKRHGYPDEIRKQALQMYVDGMNFRRIGRHLDIHHSTVSLWVSAYAAKLKEIPMPQEVKEAEMDELFTFIGDKKTKSSS